MTHHLVVGQEMTHHLVVRISHSVIMIPNLILVKIQIVNH